MLTRTVVSFPVVLRSPVGVRVTVDCVCVHRVRSVEHPTIGSVEGDLDVTFC